MSDLTTRRMFLSRLVVGGLALSALSILQACQSAAPAAKPAAPAPAPAAPAPAAPAPAGQAAPVTKTGGIDPALIEASKKEGKLVWYTPTVEEDMVKMLAAFKAKYPWVDTSEFLRLQTGKLYAKFEPEMQQGVQSADVITLSEIAIALDAQKKGYFEPYASTDLAKYDKKWKSEPEGYWTTYYTNLAGMAWNTNLVKPDEAPKTYNDLLDPKWGNGQINFKDSASGLQYNQYVMLARLYGEGWWDKLALQKPVALAGVAQQFEKCVNGEIKIIGMGQTSQYAQMKGNGAPIGIILPKEGVATTVISISLVKNAPHPATGKLWIEWLLSEDGQKAVVDITKNPVTRPGAPPPPETPRMEDMNVFWPKAEEMAAYIDGQPAWTDRWNKLMGM